MQEEAKASEVAPGVLSKSEKIPVPGDSGKEYHLFYRRELPQGLIVQMKERYCYGNKKSLKW